MRLGIATETKPVVASTEEYSSPLGPLCTSIHDYRLASKVRIHIYVYIYIYIYIANYQHNVEVQSALTPAWCMWLPMPPVAIYVQLHITMS